ncbi:pyridoxal phosphate-dependent aminotransferase [Roseburia sp. AF15-21]|jgi:aminotransferase|uniref:pyridoxal phosphate-dependent aminotransferase n=1 Tax=Roseburia sp. AF15-21 TaxID=2293128 RepID=UPI000E511766|nr:pyridoxal phosphate-dependent aminotransferase [Roseburia sp. AF15-21]RHR86068.1 pyridoxal phosphate-dependent aminotransferase [Roseburia sp. AF15-21]
MEQTLRDGLNDQILSIEVSLIRKFDEQTSDVPDILKLTLGEPDFNTPEHIKQAAIKGIEENFTHYTANAGMPDLLKGVAAFMKTKYHLNYDPAGEILTTVGAEEGVAASILTALNPGDKVIVPSPIYTAYVPLIRLARAVPITVDTSDTGMVLTPERLEKAIEENGGDIKAIVLNYPSNPTGVTYLKEELAALAEVIKKHHILAICDEIYSELTYGDEPHHSMAEFAKENTIVINGLSKSHAMTGWRVGFILASADIIKEIRKTHMYLVSSTSSISQKAALEAVTAGIDDALGMRKEYQKRRDFLYEKLSALGFEIARPNGAFYIFAKIPAGQIQDSMQFCVDLAKKAHLSVIPGIAFGKEGEGYIRISYAAAMEKLEEAMRRMESYILGK